MGSVENENVTIELLMRKCEEIKSEMSTAHRIESAVQRASAAFEIFESTQSYADVSQVWSSFWLKPDVCSLTKKF